MTEIMVREYLGSGIEFKMVEDQVYANATSMCKPFGKLVKDWLKTAQTQRYITALERKDDYPNGLVEVIQGGISDNQGTWIHEKLILKLAQWLDVEFELFCDDVVATLLKEGKVELKKPSYEIDNPKERALRWLEEYEEKEKLQLEVKEKEEIIEIQKPKVEYYEKVLDSSASFTVTQIAKAFEMTAVSLNKVLQNQGIQFYQSGTWHLYSKYQGKGYEDIRTHILPNGKTRKSLVWTEKGMEFIGQVLESL